MRYGFGWCQDCWWCYWLDSYHLLPVAHWKWNIISHGKCSTAKFCQIAELKTGSHKWIGCLSIRIFNEIQNYSGKSILFMWLLLMLRRTLFVGYFTALSGRKFYVDFLMLFLHLFVAGIEGTCYKRQIQRSFLCTVRPSTIDKEVSRTKSVKENYSRGI